MTITESVPGMYTFYTALVMDPLLGMGVDSAVKTAFLGIRTAALLYQNEELDEPLFELGHAAASTILPAPGILFPDYLNR